MFGKNEVVGKSFFKDAQDKLLVTTIFTTLQGEGPYAGYLSIFVRLAKCNLSCSWCDTYFDSGDWFTIDDLVAKIRTYVPQGMKPQDIGIVFTGGEPSLQQNLIPLLDRLNAFRWTQIESNGIISLDYPLQTTLVVSPKCREKNGVAVEYLKPNQKTLDKADCLKFVISADPNSPYHIIPDWALEWKYQTGCEIYISPMNMYLQEPRAVRENAVKNSMSLEERSIVNEKISFWEEGLLDREANQKNHEYAALYCMQHNLRLNLQQHIYANLP